MAGSTHSKSSSLCFDEPEFPVLGANTFPSLSVRLKRKRNINPVIIFGIVLSRVHLHVGRNWYENNFLSISCRYQHW